ncbi:hypothetical protein B6D14_07980 [Gilliamella apis]|nr:hypothetical protein B6D14_07980 [Gilliamella apis]
MQYYFLLWFTHERDAPLGLTWGASISDIVSKYNAKEIIEKNDLTIYELPNPPITLPNITSYKLLALLKGKNRCKGY